MLFRRPPLRAFMRYRGFGLMSSSRPEHCEEARFRVMRTLQENPSVSTREIADVVGISNAAYDLLAALIERGLVKAQNFSKSEQKSKYMYILTPALGIADVTTRTVPC